MSNDINLLEQTIPTKQMFPGPNRSLAGSKSVLCAVDVEVQGEQTSVPPQYKFIEVVGYLTLSAISAGDYTDSFLDKAGIGSEYKELVVSGTPKVVSGAVKHLKTANAGVKADWTVIS